MNSINLIGRLTADPEMKESKGYKYCQFSLAVDRPMSKEKTVDFFNCTAFNKTAEIIVEYCRKGKQLGVNGILQTNRKDKVTYFTIAVNNITLVGSRDDDSKPKRAKAEEDLDDDFYDDEPKSKQTKTKDPKPMEDDDEYPF